MKKIVILLSLKLFSFNVLGGPGPEPDLNLVYTTSGVQITESGICLDSLTRCGSVYAHSYIRMYLGYYDFSSNYKDTYWLLEPTLNLNNSGLTDDILSSVNINNSQVDLSVDLLPDVNHPEELLFKKVNLTSTPRTYNNGYISRSESSVLENISLSNPQSYLLGSTILWVLKDYGTGNAESTDSSNEINISIYSKVQHGNVANFYLITYNTNNKYDAEYLYKLATLGAKNNSITAPDFVFKATNQGIGSDGNRYINGKLQEFFISATH